MHVLLMTHAMHHISLNGVDVAIWIEIPWSNGMSTSSSININHHARELYS